MRWDDSECSDRPTRNKVVRKEGCVLTIWAFKLTCTALCLTYTRFIAEATIMDSTKNAMKYVDEGHE